MKTRQWVLNKRPTDKLTSDCFRLQDIELSEDALEEGEVLVKNAVFGIAPTMRNWMNASGSSYRASVNLGDPLRGLAAGEIIASRNTDYPVGSRITCLSEWQDVFKFVPQKSPAPVIRVPENMSLKDAMGVYGANSLTAYLGLVNVAKAKQGDTLVVSGAAGSVGSMVTQVGKNLGCRVIAIAGGAQKCKWLRETCGADEAIDYKNENVSEALARLCPDGVDVFFDNVGGEILQAVMENIARRGVIAVCGQISAYDSESTAPGPKDMMKVVYWSVRIQGFLLGDFSDADIVEAQQQLVAWVEAGKIANHIDVRQGFEKLPETLMDIFKGGNIGTLMVESI